MNRHLVKELPLRADLCRIDLSPRHSLLVIWAREEDRVLEAEWTLFRDKPLKLIIPQVPFLFFVRNSVLFKLFNLVTLVFLGGRPDDRSWRHFIRRVR